MESGKSGEIFTNRICEGICTDLRHQLWVYDSVFCNLNFQKIKLYELMKTVANRVVEAMFAELLHQL